MTKISPGIDETMLKESIVAVSADVSFAYDHFPKYKLGPDNQILEEPRGVNNGSPLKEVVERETTQLSEQHKRLSVCDLASKFDKNLATSVKLADEYLNGKEIICGFNKTLAPSVLREVASLEGHVILKKLRDALESLRGCMAGRNKEDVEKAISMVDALAVKLTQKEGERIQEKFEVKKPANFLKQVSSWCLSDMGMHPTRVWLDFSKVNSISHSVQSCCWTLVANVSSIEHHVLASKSTDQALDTSEWDGVIWSMIISDTLTYAGAHKTMYAPEPFDVGLILQAEILSNDQKVSVITANPIDSG
ncbi:Stomatal closure-related actin-binding protein 1 [Hibiscus syriacus]|uniref:Stomatal closure-related actin-binding protein 1 n=1 Tax=Hibiscus syriacus TaxID=106335 RepID=A0A6A2YFM6_HIBSY|nr:Stomatal closure-related actin-binding protein 1 [Hibiscus syriacus]